MDIIDNEYKILIDALKYTSEIIISLTEKLSNQENKIILLEKIINDHNNILIKNDKQLIEIQKYIEDNYKITNDTNKKLNNYLLGNIEILNEKKIPKSIIKTNENLLNEKAIVNKEKIDNIINSILKRKNDLDISFKELNDHVNNNKIIKSESKIYTELNSDYSKIEKVNEDPDFEQAQNILKQNRRRVNFKKF